MVQLQETFEALRRSDDVVALDGTLRVPHRRCDALGPPEGSLVVIENTDNGVHPSRARHLLDSIRSVAERRKLRVLLSTHNPTMLDALPDAAVPDVGVLLPRSCERREQVDPDELDSGCA